MSRATVILNTPEARETVRRWISKVPDGTRVELKGPKRTLPQNDRFWAMLTDIATQKEHFGRKHPTEIWKAIMMNAAGREVQFLPTLDGQGVFPLAYSSSELSVDEMRDLMTFMEAWGAENGVEFHDPRAPGALEREGRAA